jgi:hypothetical protein
MEETATEVLIEFVLWGGLHSPPRNRVTREYRLDQSAEDEETEVKRSTIR